MLQFNSKNENSSIDYQDLFSKITIEKITSFFQFENLEGNNFILGNLKFTLDFDRV